MEDTDIVGFGLAPRINAVGRLADARAAVELLTTESVEEAQKLAGQLELENARRQELCERIFEEADRYVSRNIDLATDKALAIFDKGWQPRRGWYRCLETGREISQTRFHRRARSHRRRGEGFGAQC